MLPLVSGKEKEGEWRERGRTEDPNCRAVGRRGVGKEEDKGGGDQ